MDRELHIVGIIPARMDSQRLAGKVLRRAKGIPLVGYVAGRAQRIPGLNRMVIATTTRRLDNPIEDYAKTQGIDVFRGDKDDVALRFLRCAEHYGADYFVRLNGDSPFPDEALITEGINAVTEHGYDFVTNLVGRSFPYGISVEIVSTPVYARAYPEMRLPDEREHVTAYFYSRQQNFHTYCMTTAFDVGNTRIVVDTEEDWLRFERAVHILGESVWTAGYREIAAIYQRMKG